MNLNSLANTETSNGEHSDTIKCQHCFKFLHKLNLQRHIERIHNASEKSSTGVQKDCLQRNKVRFATNGSQPKKQDSGIYTKMGIASISATSRNQKCNICKKSFASNPLLRYHMLEHIKAIQQKLQSHKCDDCKKTFMKSHDLMKHKQDSHPLDLNLKCGSCEKVFVQGNQLKNHENTVHKVMKLYKCNSCEKKFNSRGNRRNHTIKVHIEQNEVPISEDLNKTFNSPKQKSPKKLSFECDKVLPSVKGKDKMKCEFCTKTFKQNLNLSVHIRFVHKEKEKHACNVCGMDFRFPANFKYHMDNFHKKEPATNVSNVANLFDNMEI